MSGDYGIGSSCYEIRVRGVLDAGWADWLASVMVTDEAAGETVFHAQVTDQAALRSLLDRIWNANLVLISVQRADS